MEWNIFILACLVCVAKVSSQSRQLTKGELKEFKEAFALLDKDGDGEIATKELGTVFEFLGLSLIEAELKYMVEDFDADGNGSTNLVEFLDMMGRKMEETGKVKEIKEGFRVLDTDSDGYITYEEVKWVFSGLGENLTDKELDEMIRDTDTDRDSLISIEEYVVMMHD